MSSIRVRFITTDSFVSAAIRKLTGSLFSHVEIGTPEGTWIGAHIEDGIQNRPANYCNPTREYVYDIPCLDWQAGALLGWARKQIGTKYNVKTIVGIALGARSLTSPSKFICSQFVADGLILSLGAKDVLNVLPQWTYRITPETLHLSPIFVGNLTRKSG